jgi:hypothetical protein
MPWAVLIRPPGGATGKVRKHYAVVQKLSLLEEAYVSVKRVMSLYEARRQCWAYATLSS